VADYSKVLHQEYYDRQLFTSEEWLELLTSYKNLVIVLGGTPPPASVDDVAKLSHAENTFREHIAQRLILVTDENAHGPGSGDDGIRQQG